MQDHRLLEILAHSILHTATLQQSLASDAKLCSQKHRESTNQRMQLALQTREDAQHASMTHSAYTVCHWMASFIPLCLCAPLPIPKTGMFGLVCAGNSAMFRLMAQRMTSPQHSTAKIAKVADLIGTGCALGSVMLLPTPMGLAARTFSSSMALLSGGVSLYGEHCKKKSLKKELRLEAIETSLELEQKWMRTTTKAFGSSMTCDARSFALIRQISILNAQCVDDVLKPHG